MCTNGKSGQDEGDKSGQRMREAGASDRGSAGLLWKSNWIKIERKDLAFIRMMPMNWRGGVVGLACVVWFGKLGFG